MSTGVDSSSPESVALSTLTGALDLYESENAAAFDMINAMAEDDPQLLVVYNITTNEIVADGEFPVRVGQDAPLFFQAIPSDVIYESVAGYTGIWKEHTESYPDTGERRIRTLSVVHGDGYIFQASYIYSPMNDAQDQVDSAIRLYDSDPNTAFDRITWQAVKTSLIYPLVFNGTDFTALAHGTRPDLVGAFPVSIGDTGDKSIEQIMAEIQDGPGTWVVYTFVNPITKTDQTKRTWFSLHDGHVFASGYYPTEYDLARAEVTESINLYKTNGSDAFAVINAMKTNDLIYPFVLSADTLEVVAEGAYPNVVGLPAVFLNDINAPLEEVLSNLETNDGQWVSYPFLNPAVNVPQIKHTWLSLHDGYIFGSGYYRSPNIDAQNMVRDIIQLHDVNPEATLTNINSSTGVGVTIPFVLDYDTLEVLAHGEDPDGLAPFLSDGIRWSWSGVVLPTRLQDEGSLWLSHQIIEPDGDVSFMRSWLQLHDGYVFGARYEISEAEEVRYVVEDTMYLYKLHGEGAFDLVNVMMPRFSTLSHIEYRPNPFIVDVTNNLIVADSIVPESVGEFIPVDIFYDRPLDVVFAEMAANDGIWVEIPLDELISHQFQNIRDGHLFLASYEEFPALEAQQVVKDTIQLYDADPTTALDRVTWQSAKVSAIYPLVFNASDWVTVAHGAIPDRVGHMPYAILDTGDKSLEQITSEIQTNSGTWVEYLFYNPVAGLDQPKQHKRTWMSLHDGLIFAAGYYESGATVAVDVVNKTINSYDSEGKAAFDAINSMMSTDPQYPFVLNATTMNVVAHGADPSWIGKSFLMDKTQRTGADDLAARIVTTPGQGLWSGLYAIENPDTGEIQAKESWLQLHDGYIFGSGYYSFAASDE